MDQKQQVPAIISNKNHIFGAAALLFELFVMFMYGFFISENQMTYPNSPAARYVYTDLLILMILIGFGLLTTYIKHTNWSGLGNTLLMTAFSIQTYFLINVFFTKAQVQPSSDTFSNSMQSIGIRPYSTYGLDITSALQAVISIYVASSGLHGRITLLETFLLSTIGTIGYQLNRQILVRIGTNDNGGSIGIFVYGSVLGIVVSAIISDKESTAEHQQYRSSKKNGTLALLGSLFLWCFFPVLNLVNVILDNSRTSIYNPFISVVGIATWLALSASVIGTFSTSILIHNKINLHDVVLGSFSGAIAYGSSSNIVFYPVAAIVVGFTTGIINTTSLSGLTRVINSKGVISSNGLIETFFISGFLGGIWAAIFCAFGGFYTFASNSSYVSPIINVTNNSNFYQGGMEIVGLLISIGIPILVGLFIAIPLRFTDNYPKEAYFNDNAFFTIENTEIKDDVEQMVTAPNNLTTTKSKAHLIIGQQAQQYGGQNQDNVRNS